MSRVAKNPVQIPSGVEVFLDGGMIKIKGKKGEVMLQTHPAVALLKNDDNIVFSVDKKIDERTAWMQAGTLRALTSNMIHGVSEGWEKRLTLVGVGYRARVQGKNLNLMLGFSHPVNYPIPAGITIETPSQTEIVVKGVDKQAVGQAAAEIRAYRPPEPYKGKGIRYADEYILRKDAKKK